MTRFWIFSTLAAGGCMAWLLSIPSETYAGMPFGLSPVRLALMGLLILAMLVSGLLAVGISRRTHWLEKAHRVIESWYGWLLPIMSAVFMISLFFALLPVEQAGGFASYLVRLRPLIVYVLLFSGLAGFGLMQTRSKWRVSALLEHIKSETGTWRLALGISLGIGGVVGIAWLTGFGIDPDIQAWNTPSIPVTGIQIMIIVLIGLFWGLMVRLSRKHIAVPARWLDFLLPVMLWMAAALIWNLTPLPAGYFAPGPYPPDGQFHPFSDAVKYDLGGQYMIIGEGILNGTFTDRPVYMAFLGLLRWLGGQNYSISMTLQASVLALSAPILYFIGQQVSGRRAGVLVSILFILQEANTITATRYVSVSHARWMLTELPAMLFMAAATLAFLSAYRRKPAWFHLLECGGLIGLGTMVRANPLFLLIGCLGFWAITHVRQPRKAISGILLMGLAFFACTLPWMMRTGQKNNIALFYLPKLQNVLEKRYQAPAVPVPEFQTEKTDEEGSASSGAQNDDASSIDQGLLARVEFIPKHMLHGMIGSLFVMPARLSMQTLPSSMQTFPYTDSGLTAPPFSLIPALLVELILLGIGSAWAWKRAGWAGWTPWMLFVVFHLSNGFARSSGGRYQVGADWVMLLYVAAGLMVVARYLFVLMQLGSPRMDEEKEQVREPVRGRWTLGLILAGIWMVGAMPAIVEDWIPRFYTQNGLDILDEGILADNSTNLNIEALRQFAGEDGAIVAYGRLLYPRYYYADQGEPDRESIYRGRAYPRLVITLLTPDGVMQSVLPVEDVPELESGVDALLLGCKNPGEIQIHTLILPGEDKIKVFERLPRAPMTCPLPEPICDDNHNCQ